mgnify:CR=1 FL=1
MNITIEFRAFEDQPRVLTIKKDYSDVFVSPAKQDNYVLEDMFRAFNHAIPGETGELAEAHKTRSLSVGDRVSFNDKTWECDMVGWKEII